VRHFPLAAPARERLAPGLRVTFHHPYAIYYRPMPDAVVIVRGGMARVTRRQSPIGGFAV